jgi:N-acetylglucosaminyldiphosphoundecaprenol N-acetyl-beta-D-mannosaminyltransferase
MDARPTTVILDVAVHCVDFAQTIDQITTWIESPVAGALCRQVCTVNPEFIIDAHRDPAFANVLRRADLRVPDGVGVLWAARRNGVRLAERVTGSDGIYRLCEQAARRGWRVYFLGAAAGVAERAAWALQQRYPTLNVSGVYSGSPAEQEWPVIQQRLAEAQPDLLFVAYGHPRQDLWIDRHRHHLPARVAIGVGGAFDFVAGVRQRAPAWLQRLGLEWLHRLLHEPWRWRRMVKLPQFVALVLIGRSTGRRPGSKEQA